MDYGLEVHANEFFTMSGAFHNVIRWFLAANRMDKPLNSGTEELRLEPATICRAVAVDKNQATNGK